MLPAYEINLQRNISVYLWLNFSNYLYDECVYNFQCYLVWLYQCKYLISVFYTIKLNYILLCGFSSVCRAPISGVSALSNHCTFPKNTNVTLLKLAISTMPKTCSCLDNMLSAGQLGNKWSMFIFPNASHLVIKEVPNPKLKSGQYIKYRQKCS